MTDLKGFAPKTKDWLKIEGKNAASLPPGYEELQPALVAFRQEAALFLLAPGKGWTHRLVDSLKPGVQALRSLGKSLKEYETSRDVTVLDAAIAQFHNLSKRQQRQGRTLAFEILRQATELYTDDSAQLVDLKRAIQAGNAAQSLWSDGTNPGVYGCILYNLAEINLYAYTRSFEQHGTGDCHAKYYEVARDTFLKVVKNNNVGDFRFLARIQVGILVLTRFHYEKTTADIGIWVEHLEAALEQMDRRASMDTNVLDEDTGAAMLMAWITYQLGVAHQLQYSDNLDRDTRLKNLDTTIRYYGRAIVLQEEIKPQSPQYLFALATRLVLRWDLTREAADLSRAKELLRRAQTLENHDEAFSQQITRVLIALDDL